MIVAIDFDGTIVRHEFPDIGDTVPHALRVMRRLIANNHEIILWTMRSDIPGERPVLQEAVDYVLDADGVELLGVNMNPGQDWSSSPKAYAHIYIDDAALGCPLITKPMLTVENQQEIPFRPYVDWLKVEQLLAEQGYFNDI